MVDCVLCGSSSEDSCDYGPSFHFSNKMVHSNCLYTSSNLVQRDGVRNGISGFQKADILAEVQRASKLTCFYCGRNGASIGCCRKTCRRNFHFSCGLENLVRYQFSGSYKSYCHSHVARTKARPQADQCCGICLELLMPEGKKFSPVLMLEAPCCRNGWFHKHCAQKYANNAGYFFKCPLCNSSSKFLDLRLWGIMVPNSDASWETEPNAFQDQLVRDVICTVPDCIALDGPDSDVANIIYCQLCGSKPVHCYCVAATDTYVCETCSAVSPPPDDSEDEFEVFASTHLAGSRHDSRDQNRQNYRDKLRAPSIEDEDDDEEDDWESIADQAKALRPTVRPHLANAPSAATESPARTPYGLALRSRSRSSLARLATAPSAAAAAPAAEVRQSNTSRRGELAAEREAGMTNVARKDETEATPIIRESRRRRQSSPRPRENVAPESPPATVSCVSSRTRKRTAAKPKK
ncbi:G2/M phase-specific E3 ubiquitin-protein ligase [Drosophila pseudoobscura]|uniref:G2/M phase-specific E3 ubiquitin-protein ligase n=1 Tax=Drosophila pseudoobscura pseudoobscura TaxID=46245 RepID=A0A6I8UG58_DROPS|nr:G2/M phase-specific E3 ubiquitin-protein ligase [Drosophila pseudoobscura]XP_033240065.1 G2/M phase-specific E3 ubiquitin-protein ligase [Drosophila pseudoobscura]